MAKKQRQVTTERNILANDATLINVQAANKRFAAIEATIDALLRTAEAQERRLTALEDQPKLEQQG